MKRWACAFVYFAFLFLIANADQLPRPEKDSERPITKISTKNSENLRKLYPPALSPNNTQCVCGQQQLLHSTKWKVEVHFNLPDTKIPTPCEGTIIAHNLLLTSKKCLGKAGNRMDTFDDWQLSLNVTTVHCEEFNLGTYKWHTYDFKVKNITSNIGVGTPAGLFLSAQDIATIVVDGDFFQPFEETLEDGTSSQRQLRLPVCIPKKDKTLDLLTQDVVHRYAYYYGYAGGYHAKLTYIDLNDVVILDGDYCDKKGHFGQFSDTGALCIRTMVSLPMIEGGPLVTTSERIQTIPVHPLPSPQTAFLVGIGSGSQKHLPGKLFSYTYFANVVQNIDFIEKVASEHGSMWCETPEFADTKKATSDDVKLEDWPWETEIIKERSETLDCSCGLLHDNGEEDEPAQGFNWIVKIHFSWTLNDTMGDDEGFICLGSIINDRVIVTAVSCVDQYEDKRTDKWHAIRKNYKIFVGSSKLSNDSDGTLVTIKNIIFHPGYKISSESFRLALIILEKPLVFTTGTTKLATDPTNDVRPICLPKVNENIDIKYGTDLTVWERGISNNTRDVLRKLQIGVDDMLFCVDDYAQAQWEPTFCRGRLHYRVWNVLRGAPNAYRKNSGKHYQVGIDFIEKNWSWDDTLDEMSVPSVDLQKFIPFIEYYSNFYNATWCKE